MAAPLSRDRIYQALRRFQPPAAYSDDEAAMPNRELMAIAWPLGRAADFWDELLLALLLEHTGLLDRWERLLRLGTRASEPLQTRTARIIPILRRRHSYTRERLSSILAPLLGVPPSELQWLEPLRADIEDAIAFSYTWPTAVAVTPSLRVVIDSPWPGNVDDVGVSLTLWLSTPNAADLTITLTCEGGPTWTVWNGTAGDFDGIPLWERSLFLGRPARGPWRLDVASTGASGVTTIEEVRLRVSNDVDSAAIYYGHCLRDVSLSVTSSVTPAQLLLNRAGITHTQAIVCERDEVLCDDAQSLTDREPIGG